MAITRRTFLINASAVPLHFTALAQGKKPHRILLRSSWQIVNIGDIAHTPGVLALREKYLPVAEVRLWASQDLSEEVMAMEHRRFPKLQIGRQQHNYQSGQNPRRLQKTPDRAIDSIGIKELQQIRKELAPGTK